jgi:hypothetical protein
MKTIKCCVTVLGMLLLAHDAHCAVLFDNLGTPLGLFNAGASQVGDEIVLAGGAATVTSFSFEYFGSNFVGGESAEVYFYKNDGSPSAGYASPNTLLWDSGTFSIPGTFDASSPPGTPFNALVTFNNTGLVNDLPLAGVAVPGDFTWAVVFTGVGAGESVGTILSSAAPTTGMDYNDYWLNTGTVASPVWQLMTSSPQNIDFLAQVNSVPEPSTLALFDAGVIGLACLGFKRLDVRG